MFLYFSLIIVMIPAVAVGIWAQYKFNNAFETYSAIKTKKKDPAVVVARSLLGQSRATKHVMVLCTEKHLSDHYNPKKKEVVLSSSIHRGNNIAAVSVAAHEVGHAVQHGEKSILMMIWQVVGLVANISSQILWPIMILGMVFGLGSLYGPVGDIFVYIGLAFFGITLIYSLANLPLELDASRRALKMLKKTGDYDKEELAGAKVVLDAAALTYLAATITSFLYMLRFVLYILAMRSRRR